MNLFIVGAGGHGRVCAEIAEAMGYYVLGFVDVPLREGERINGKPVVNWSLHDLPRSDQGTSAAVFIAISANEHRCELVAEAEELGLTVPILIHPSAVISRTCEIGAGTVVMPGVVVNANTKIGRSCILNTACSVDHDSVLEDGVQVCPGAHGAGAVHYGRCSFIGTGASIKQGIAIGAGAVVGAGTVLICDVPPDVTIVGNPGRIIRDGSASR